MNDNFWKQFPVDPDFSCLEMKWRAQERINEATKGMTFDQKFDWFRRREKERAERRELKVAEAPPDYGRPA